jgi:alpha-L-arabinofuranosidase
MGGEIIVIYLSTNKQSEQGQLSLALCNHAEVNTFHCPTNLHSTSNIATTVSHQRPAALKYRVTR